MPRPLVSFRAPNIAPGEHTEREDQAEETVDRQRNRGPPLARQAGGHRSRAEGVVVYERLVGGREEHSTQAIRPGSFTGRRAQRTQTSKSIESVISHHEFILTTSEEEGYPEGVVGSVYGGLEETKLHLLGTEERESQ